MIGCRVLWKCLVACLFFELSQQPTWPQVMHSRRWTHRSPIFRQSPQPVELGLTVRIWSTCGQVAVISVSSLLPKPLYQTTSTARLPATLVAGVAVRRVEARASDQLSRSDGRSCQ